MSKVLIELQSSDNSKTMEALLDKASSLNFEMIQNLSDYLDGIKGGLHNSNLRVRTGVVTASLAGTFTGAPTAAQTATINGVVFTARASGAGANEFNIGVSVTATALNFANAVNASVTAGVAGVVTAVPLAGVVTIYSDVPGPAGNGYTVAENMDNFTWAGAATKLASGTEVSNVLYGFGLAESVS